MATFRVLLAGIAAVCMVAPAAAEWSAFGSIEPDTAYDADWIWADPPAIGESKIYFQGISGTHYPPASALGKPWVNPNVAALGTHFEPFALEYHNAILGVWVDCNGDGYVGAAETGVREYPADAFDVEEACPLVPGPAATWIPGAHNYNGWVSELIPIMRNTNLSNDARVYRDDDVRVWGDFDRPDEHPTYKTCPAFPWPRGTYQSTGGVLSYVDCRSDLLEAFNNGMGTIGDPLGLRFSDADDGRTGMLGQFDLGGPEDESHTPATVWDCDADPVFHSGDQTNATPLAGSVPAQAQNVQVYALDPQPGNLDDPSAAGLANHTLEGAQPLQSALGPDESWNCDTSDDFGHDVYGQVETDFNAVDPDNKREANWNFGTSTTTRGAVNVGTVAGQPVRVDMPVFGGASGAPQDGALGPGGTRWVSDSTWGTKTPRTVRADLATGEVGIADAYWLTFYAQLGPATLARGFLLKAEEPGTYGEWACGEHESGIHEGWNCDGSIWYRNPDGTFPADLATRAKPGWEYHLRDVDCYDGHIDVAGVGVMPASFGENPCP